MWLIPQLYSRLVVIVCNIITPFLAIISDSFYVTSMRMSIASFVEVHMATCRPTHPHYL